MLYIVATPIGNMEDITFRAIRILKSVNGILAEDTRKTRKILSHYKISKPIISFHSHTSRNKTESVITRLKSGDSLALCTDAGTPLFSDPGYELVQKCIEQKIPVTSIPGASALTAGLPLSGLPLARFAFEGFLSSRPSRRRKELKALSSEPRTLVLFESPHRLLKTLTDIYTIMGDRNIAVLKELTKKFEDIFRGKVSRAVKYYESGIIRGEYMIVIEGNPEGLSQNQFVRNILKEFSA